MELDKAYNHNESEREIYKFWEQKSLFAANPDRAKKPFCVIMPPPNANGSLHIGHALFVTLEDIMVRYHRMKGECSLWLPGADHAGFETQVVFDKKLEKEGRKRSDIPEKELLNEMREFTMENKKVMEEQLRRLGASCDWSRGKFTLDEDIIKIVYETFEKLKKDGLVYKGQRIVNWCSKHQTSLSDLETKHEERLDKLYFIKYPIAGKANEFIEVATTRPETMLGDTAVAVSPKDKRYSALIGRKAILPLSKREIPIIADEAVDPEFGTGAVKITPAHDFADFEIWQRHQAEIQGPISVIDSYGRINSNGLQYQGLKIAEARDGIIVALKQEGLLDDNRIQDYKHSVAKCYKCGTIIEPLIMDNQWFVKMTEKPRYGGLSLRDLAVKAVKDGEIKFIPERFEKVFLQWMENLRDWNISRQIPWGIKIPDSNDVFDTWFSSGQWPFATLKASQKGDFEYFYPTTVMETGADILFFWVARMVMLGIYVTGQVPFRYVYLHGLVRDKDRQKMAKSKGNVVDPLGVVDLHGADALRMALVFANSPGQDISFSEEKIVAQRRFANKIWNASRFVLKQVEGGEVPDFGQKYQAITPADEAIVSAFKQVVQDITKEIDNFQFHEAAQKVYHFFWHTYCDIYIEAAKKQIKEGDSALMANTKLILVDILKGALKLIHPFMPFVSERSYQLLPNKQKEALIIEDWPVF